MPKQLFEPGNQEGKKRGPNKISSKVKEAIVGFLEANVGQIQESFDELKAREKLEFIADILPYAAPKLSSIQTENETTIHGSWEITLNINGQNKVRQTLDAGIPNTDN